MAIAHVPVATNENTRDSRLFDSVFTYIKKSAATIVRIYIIVVGDGSQRRDLETLAVTLKVSDRVAFLGRVDDPQLIDLYAGEGWSVDRRVAWPEARDRSV